jgi:hypothetical protein
LYKEPGSSLPGTAIRIRIYVRKPDGIVYG